MGDDVFCKWERHRFPSAEFEVRESAQVHVSAGMPFHTSAGRLFLRGELEFSDREVDDYGGQAASAGPDRTDES